MEPIQVRMLGEFSLRIGDTVISDTASRSKRVWNLLAYLICNRDRSFSSQALIDLLWGSSDITNPENALRITLHRLRTQLEQLQAGAGRTWILRSEEGYGWNPEIPVSLDCEAFEALALQHAADEDRRLEAALEALRLYRGEFLPKHASEMWIIPISTHFQNRYLMLSMEAARLLSLRGRHGEAVQICRRAVEAEPYHEPLHQILMQELSATGDVRGAAAVYDQLSRTLFDSFGVRPNDETRAVYRACAHSPENRELPMDEVLEHIQEPQGNSGAMQCDYDHFKVLCYAEARSMERSGNAAHIALLRLSSGSEKELSRRSLDRIMDQLGDTLRGNLRRGDVISRCSVSQYIIMLPQANFENSCMVCRRVIAAFHRDHPHISVRIHYMVQPLTPGICVPQ